MRSILLAAFVLIVAMSAPTRAAADLPVYEGAMTFQSIQGPDGPEEFSWEVHLFEGQYLQQIDDTHAGVFYEEGHPAFSIEAVGAHAADGITVPTTLAVTQPNIVTLTVHHRNGNPAGGGAAFDYPVTAGSGWEGGIQTYFVEGPLGKETAPRNQSLSEPTCIVPDLTGRTLRASRKILHQAHCRLGAVRGEQIRTAYVVSQRRQIGKSLPLWTRVDVKALTGRQYSRRS
jgi:hypothetical protein